MKRLEFTRNKKVEEYVFITQVLFLVLTGILLARVYKPFDTTFPTLYITVLLLFIPLMMMFLLKGLGKKFYRLSDMRADDIINAFYLAVVLFGLIYEKENLFMLLLLMPVLVSAVNYGLKRGLTWAFLVTLGILGVSIIRTGGLVDGDILVTGFIWLIAWLLGNMSDSEKKIREDLHKQASVDSLTGLYNHRSFYQLIDEYFNKAKIAGSELTLLMLDVDFFKYYNDSYGHPKGDEVLAQMGRLIDGCIGERGFCARYGGDEFAVILPDCDGKSGREIAEKIRKKVEGTAFEGAGILPQGRFTVSIGVANFPEHAEIKEDLVAMADEALYKAKYTNTNKVEMYYSVFDEIGHSLQDKEKDLLNSMRTLLMVVNAKDRYTYGHSERVMHYALQIGRKLALWEWELKNLTIGALLHDIGKIEIAREILNKPGSLTTEEREAIISHPIWGADMIRPISSLSDSVEAVLYHHENYDGSGYPYNLKNKEIPIFARILRVADSFDAMTSNRPYKKIMTIQEALEDLERYRGRYYDPEVVDAFREYILETGIVERAS